MWKTDVRLSGKDESGWRKSQSKIIFELGEKKVEVLVNQKKNNCVRLLVRADTDVKVTRQRVELEK